MSVSFIVYLTGIFQDEWLVGSSLVGALSVMKFLVTRVKRSPNVVDLHGRLGKLGGRATWW